MNIGMGSYIHTYIHTYIHKYICTYINTYIHTYIGTYSTTILHNAASAGKSKSLSPILMNYLVHPLGALEPAQVLAVDRHQWGSLGYDAYIHTYIHTYTKYIT